MKKLYSLLAYAGTLPFIFSTLSLAFNQQTLLGLGSVETILSVYALIIATFLAGSHWGQHLNLKGKWSNYLPLFSNGCAILLWLCFLSISFPFLLFVFIVVFVCLLWIDFQLFRQHLISSHYFRTRCFATAIVVSTLVIARALI